MTTLTPDEMNSVEPRRRLRVPLAVAYLLAAVAMLANYLGLAPVVALALIPGFREGAQELPMAAQVPLALLQNLGVAVMAVLLVWLLMRFVCRRTLREAGFLFTARSLPLLLLGVAASVLVAVPSMLVLARWDLDGAPAPVDGPMWAYVMVSLILGFVLQGFPEELVWRGYALQLLDRRPVLSVVLTSVLFGAMHLVSLGEGYAVGERIAYLVWPTGFAFLAGALVLLTRSLWVAVGVHGGSHTANLILTLNGVGEGGATAWVVVGLVYVVAGFVVLALWRQRGGGPVRFEH